MKPHRPSARRPAWVGALLVFCALAALGIPPLRAAGRDDATREAAAASSARSARLTQAIDGVLWKHRSSLEGVDVSIQVRSVTRDEVLYERAADRSMIPASNQKLVTLALALMTFGADHVFRTPMLAAGPIDRRGTLDGDLWLVGSGDPTMHADYFDSDDAALPLSLFVDALELHGVQRIRGDLVLDDRLFAREGIPDSWPGGGQRDLEFCAPCGAFTLNNNCFDVWIRGGARTPSLSLAPKAHGYRIDSQVKTAGTKLEVGFLRPTTEGIVRALGKIGPQVPRARFRVPVSDPTKFFGASLAAAIRDAGIGLDGEVRRAADNEQPQRPKELYTRCGAMLPAAYLCGKESDNLAAEQLFKAAVAKRDGVGSYERGASSVAEFLAGLGVDTGSVVVADGSGLARANRTTARALTQLLAAMYRSEHRDAFLRALPISGIDGTLAERMSERGARHRVRAKTGYLNSVSSLSGYLYAGGGEGGQDDRETGEVCAFSVLMRGFGGGQNSRMKATQDDVCRAVLESLR